jgi:hypothetical protein
MLRTLDKAYFRLKDAWTVLRGEDAILKAYTEGVTEGVEIANARIMRQLSITNPHQFESNHFKLGYYYASETVKKVIHGEDNPLD